MGCISNVVYRTLEETSIRRRGRNPKFYNLVFTTET
ncbi:hypothetical protein SAMN05421752_101289 [Natronorubrum thiooxidans]|uniref:Uncharacterized protein n=1 Tax=Natronorubrum thiooxidans TaxID=308853 RepID=A0A1N7CE40_9EURY|nr:hypothetical protein SAMN05421752_101289 [Natronorubrum thiooxidans]